MNMCCTPQLSHGFFQVVELLAQKSQMLDPRRWTMEIQTASVKHKLYNPQNYGKNIKLSRNKSWRLRREMKCWASILIFIHSTTRMAELSALCTSRTAPPTKFLGFTSVRCWVDTRAAECRQKELGTLKFPRTVLRIKSENSHLVVQFLNQMHFLASLSTSTHIYSHN